MIRTNWMKLAHCCQRMSTPCCSTALDTGCTLSVARIALAVDTLQQGWVILPAIGQTSVALPAELADAAADRYTVHNGTYWQWTGLARANQEVDTWYMAGTLPNWKATPLALVV